MKWNRPYTICIFLMAHLCGCGAETALELDGAAGSTPDQFHAPQALVFSGDYLVVANTAFDGESLEFGSGSITLVDPLTRTVVRQIPTSGKNPQALLEVNGNLYVLCTGATEFEKNDWLTVARTPGALDIFPVAELDKLEGPAQSLPLPLDENNPTLGAMSSMVATSDEKFLFLGGSLNASLYRVDLENWTLENGSQNPISVYPHNGNDSTFVFRHSNGLIQATSFNTDRLFSLDPESMEWIDPDGALLAKGKQLEGLLQSIELPNGAGFLGLMSLANRLSLLPENGELEPGVMTVGPIANQMVLHGESVFVVNSGSNNVTEYHWPTRTSKGTFGILPVGSNPWHMAVDPTEKWGVVTLQGSHGIAWLEMETGNVLEIIR